MQGFISTAKEPYSELGYFDMSKTPTLPLPTPYLYVSMLRIHLPLHATAELYSVEYIGVDSVFCCHYYISIESSTIYSF